MTVGVLTKEEGWARYFEKYGFSEFELLTFTQLIKDDSFEYPPDHIISNFVTRRRVNDTSKFLSTNMRNILDIYCRFLHTMGKVFNGNINDGKDFVNMFIATLASSVNIPLGCAIGLFCWMEKYAIQKWCNDYGERDIDGTGYYIVHKTNLLTNNWQEHVGEFAGKYYPPIEHFVKDSKYSDLTVDIAVPPQVAGVFEPKDSKFFDYVALDINNFHSINVVESAGQHKYTFEVDTASIELCEGSIFFYNKVGSSIEISAV